MSGRSFTQNAVLLALAITVSFRAASRVSRALPLLLRYCNIRTPAAINCLAVSSAEPVIRPASNITYNLGITRCMESLCTVGVQQFFDEMGIKLTRHKIRMRQDAPVQRNRRFDSLNYEHFQGALHPTDCFAAIPALYDQFRNQ